MMAVAARHVLGCRYVLGRRHLGLGTLGGQETLDPCGHLLDGADRGVALLVLQIDVEFLRERDDDLHQLDGVYPEIDLKIRVRGQ